MKQLVTLFALLSASVFAVDPSGTSREVRYKNTDIVPIATQLRFTTLVALDESETIVEASCGDKDNWVIDWIGNLAYIKPSVAKERTNINIVTQSGHVYTLFASEVTGSATPADLKVFIVPTNASSLVGQHGKPRYVSATEIEEANKRAADAEAKLAEQTARLKAETEKQKAEAVASVTAAVVHDYKYKVAGIHQPFNVSSIYHDDKFTYIEANPSELPAVYELKDGKDSLIQFEYDEMKQRYTVPKVLDAGYLRVGKKSLTFRRSPKAKTT